MQIAVVTLFPGMLKAVDEYGVTGRAVRNGQLVIRALNPRDFTEDVHRSVDDRPYGGGPGMVMMVEPLRKAIHEAKNDMPSAPVVYMSPQGRRLDQKAVSRLAGYPELILVSGRYEGVDQRLIDTEIDEEWSIGDYVLSGGELPAMVLIDAMARTLPGVLGDNESAKQDSFVNGLLDFPHYTRPEDLNGCRVPRVLLDGDHEKIRRWRMKQALGRTWQTRPDLLAGIELDEEQQRLLVEYQDEFNNEQV